MVLRHRELLVKCQDERKAQLQNYVEAVSACESKQRHQTLGRAEGGAAARMVLRLLADAREDAQA